MQPIRVHHRSLRHVTWMVLFAWVFAFATGAANACVAERPCRPDAGKAGCLKSCYDESSTRSKNGNPDFAQIPAVFLMDGLKIEPVSTTEALAGPSSECPRAQGAPLVICLLRLNL